MDQQKSQWSKPTVIAQVFMKICVLFSLYKKCKGKLITTKKILFAQQQHKVEKFNVTNEEI